MASRNPPGYYDEATLLALDQALKDIWAVLKSHDPCRDWEKDSELRTALAEKLMALVAVGITCPNELRKRTLESLPLSSLNSVNGSLNA
jgi:hypothetical protein